VRDGHDRPHRAPAGTQAVGQQQRVALARALVFRPELVLMDEPRGALDKNLRETLQHEIRHLHQRLGVTVVYVTHDQGEALTMSDHIAVFNHGRIEQLATPAELYERPANPFVADLIGENNALPGRVQAIDGSHCSVDLGRHGLIAARTGPAVHPVSNVIVSVRPERVRLGPADGQRPNIIQATVSELTYFGDHVRAHLTIGEGPGLVAKVTNMGRDLGFQAGSAVEASWALNDGLALPVAQDDQVAALDFAGNAGSGVLSEATASHFGAVE